MVSFPARPADDPEPLKPDTSSRDQIQPQIEEWTSRLEAQGIHATELVLDLVLHDLADEARQAVGATGAAVALEREGELVCRAAAGSTAPDLGVRIHTESGLSGICVQEGRTQICKDTECDGRVDADACRRLGVRSIVVIPLFSAGRIIGIFEVFSACVNAYTMDDLKKLEALAASVAQTIQTARQKSVSSAQTQTSRWPETAPEPASPLSVTSIMEKVHPVDPAVRVLRWLVIGLAIPLLLLIGFDVGWHGMRSTDPVRSPQAGQVHKATPQPEPTQVASASPSPTTPGTAKSIAPGPNIRENVLNGAGLVIYQNGKVVFREMPSLPGKKANPPLKENIANDGAIERQGTDDGVSLPAGIVGGRLLKSVRPQYPPEAILDKVEGSVVLHGTVGPDGEMQDVKVVSGDPVFSQAATEAVKQWKYEPYRRNGKPINMPIDITIDFNLPK